MLNELGVTIAMPERLVKEELGIEMEVVANMVVFLAFVNVEIDSIAFPKAQDLNVMSRNAIVICGDGGTLS